MTEAKYALYSLVGFNNDTGSVILYSNKKFVSMTVKVLLSVNSGAIVKSMPKSFIVVTFSASTSSPVKLLIYPLHSDCNAH